MLIRVYRRESVTRTAVLLSFVLMTVWFISRPQALATGISRGLSVCSGVIIPTLYPYMVLAGALTDSPVCRNPGRLMEFVTRRVFGLPGCCGPAILLGILGGYPAGALVIGRMLECGQIRQEEAQRMTCFCVNAGPGFILSTVGSGLLGSTKAGVLLFIAHAGVSLILGILLGNGHRHKEDSDTPLPLPPTRPIAQMVADTCRGLLTMCGFVVACAALLSLLESSGVALWLQHRTGVAAGRWSAGIAALLEVNCGCIALAGTGEWAPFWLCVCMGWGGLSVQGQLMAAVGDRRVFGRRFWCYRLLHGILSGGVALALFRLFPAHLPTVGGQTAVLPYTVSAGASAMLLLLSFLAMCVFSAKSTGKYEKTVV